MQDDKNKSHRFDNWFLKYQVPVIFVTLLFLLMIVLEYDFIYSVTRIVMVLVIWWIIKKISR